MFFSFALTITFNNGIFILLATILGRLPYWLYKLKVNRFIKQVHVAVFPLVFNFLNEGRITNPVISKKMILKNHLFHYADYLKSSFCLAFKHGSIGCIIQNCVIINNMGPRLYIGPECFRKYATSLSHQFKGFFICLKHDKKINGQIIVFNKKKES